MGGGLIVLKLHCYCNEGSHKILPRSARDRDGILRFCLGRALCKKIKYKTKPFSR